MSLWPALLVALAGGAAPAPLERAEALMEDFRFADAQAALAQTLATPGLSREALLRTLELQGIAAGQLRKSDEALTAFRQLLTLAPDWQLGPDLAPRVSTPFLEARQAVETAGPLTLEAEAPRRAGAVTTLGVRVPTDALGLARGVVFHVDAGGGWVRTPAALEGGRASHAVEAAGPVRWWAELLGARDAQLVRLGDEAAPLEAGVAAHLRDTAPAVTGAAPAPGTSGLRVAGWVLLGGAVAAAGAGVGFGLSSDGDRARLEGAARDEAGVITGLTQVEADRVAGAAARDGAIANGFFIGAGALAVGGAVLWWLGAPVAVAPTADGVALVGALP